MSPLQRVSELSSGSTPSPQDGSMFQFGDYRFAGKALIFPPDAKRRPLKLRHIKSILIFPDETPSVQVICKTEQFWIDIGPAHVEFLRTVRILAPWVVLGLKDLNEKVLYLWG